VLALQCTECDVCDEKRVSDVDRHVEALPDGRGKVAKPEIVASRCHQKKDE